MDYLSYEAFPFNLCWFFSPLAQACLIPGLGNQTIRLQRGKELGLMSLTSEDASSVIKEV